VTTFGAVALGAKWVERHITLDRTLWGSDQQSSIEPNGLVKLVKGIRDLDKAMRYEPQKRVQFAKEDEKRQTLRGTTKKEEKKEEEKEEETEKKEEKKEEEETFTFKLPNDDELLAGLNKLHGTNMVRDEEEGPHNARTRMERMIQNCIDRDFS
jgi:hypothetical protein